MVRACDHCGGPYKSYRKNARFCGRFCMGVASRGNYTHHPGGLRYSLNEMGDRMRLARALQVSYAILTRMLPVNDCERMRAGQMVSIGGILAKRCSRCLVTKKVEEFHNDRNVASGCSSHCIDCDRKYRLTHPRKRVRLTTSTT